MYEEQLPTVSRARAARTRARDAAAAAVTRPLHSPVSPLLHRSIRVVCMGSGVVGCFP